MVKCNICNEEFENVKIKANHVRWKHKDNSSYKKKMSELMIGQDSRFGKRIIENVICSKHDCDNEIEISYREDKKKDKYHCSRSCANSRGPRTKKQKSSMSTKIKKLWKDGHYDNIDMTSNKYWSSKNERLILNHFKTKYPLDEWTHGGIIRMDCGNGISRDMFSKKLRICFEYDGIWHFKDIHGQLKDKQNKDSLLEKWCIENNYRLIRIDEDKFKDVGQIENLIYQTSESIIKIGDRY